MAIIYTPNHTHRVLRQDLDSALNEMDELMQLVRDSISGIPVARIDHNYPDRIAKAIAERRGALHAVTEFERNYSATDPAQDPAAAYAFLLDLVLDCHPQDEANHAFTRGVHNAVIALHAYVDASAVNAHVNAPAAH